MLCRRFPGTFLEIFASFFLLFWRGTYMKLLCMAFSLYSYSSQGFFVKIQIFSIWSWSGLVTGSNAMTWSMRLSSLYKLLLPSYLSCYLSFLPHGKGWWHKTSSDTSLKINQKLQSMENNAGDKGQIISRICKLRVNSKPLCCFTFFVLS